MPGTNISSRLGASILLHYGFAEGVVTSLNEYAERVVEFYKLRKIPRIPRQIDWEFVSTVEQFFSSERDKWTRKGDNKYPICCAWKQLLQAKARQTSPPAHIDTGYAV